MNIPEHPLLLHYPNLVCLIWILIAHVKKIISISWDRQSDHNNTLLRLLFRNWLAFEHGDQTSSPPACYLHANVICEVKRESSQGFTKGKMNC
jgi:hypothetical protein